MSRTSAQKRIHYVRAVYAQALPAGQTLEKSVRAALTALKTVGDTEVNHDAVGTLAVRERGVANQNFATLGIGLGFPGEAMGTLGLKVAKAQDVNQPQAPLQGRVFKLADAFCLIDDDDLLLCMDGRMRMATVEFYLRSLLGLADAAPAAQAFQLVGRRDQGQQQTLETEGVKEMRIVSAAYAVAQPAAGNDGWLRKGWDALIENLRVGLESEVGTEAERASLAAHLGDLNVSATVKVNGGSRGEPIMVQTLEDAAIEAQQDAPDGTQITLVTKKGNEVGADTLTLKTIKSIKRLQRQNDLDYADAWNKLTGYRQELINSHRWKL
ncbi:MAG: hypothetical protein EPN56_12185 [Rhodanobacter sp.]|nr:MAG: hypothetical protein EPN56_12185 [Rhodanobacter sp.]TBR71688.1 MAG: hypothetical protein EPN64_19250 [Burkholderiaceae bacterium]